MRLPRLLHAELALLDQPTDRSFSPDRKAYLFERDHNLYLLEVSGAPGERFPFPTWQTSWGGIAGHLFRLTSLE